MFEEPGFLYIITWVEGMEGSLWGGGGGGGGGHTADKAFRGAMLAAS